MTQYTFTTHVDDQVAVVVSGFCARTATFYSKVFPDNSDTEPLYQSRPLRDEDDLYLQMERWGIYVPMALEEAISEDVKEWNFGCGNMSFFNRKAADLGYQLNQTTKKCNKPCLSVKRKKSGN